MSIKKFLKRNITTKVEQPKSIKKEDFCEEHKEEIRKLYVDDKLGYRDVANALNKKYNTEIPQYKFVNKLKSMGVWRYRKKKQTLKEIEEALDIAWDESEKNELSEEQQELEEEFFEQDSILED